jgi:hypothetical protein
MLIYYIWKSKYITDEFTNRNWNKDPSFLLMRDKCKDADADVLNVRLAEYDREVYIKGIFISNPPPPMPPVTDKSPPADKIRLEWEHYNNGLAVINRIISEKIKNANNIIKTIKGNNCSKATNAYIDTRYPNRINNKKIFMRATA